MKAMRGACKTWQQGYELGVSSITIHMEDPVLPLGYEAAQRFPGLKCLNIGDSQTELGDLQGLRAFSNLDKLVLGEQTDSQFFMASCLTDAEMHLLEGLPLTHLGLHGCMGLTDQGLVWLHGMPLR